MIDESIIIKRYLSSGNFILTVHAQERMSLRFVSAADIKECGRTAFIVKLQEDKKYKVKGYDLDGDDLTIICALLNNLVVVTVF